MLDMRYFATFYKGDYTDTCRGCVMERYGSEFSATQVETLDELVPFFGALLGDIEGLDNGRIEMHIIDRQGDQNDEDHLNYYGTEFSLEHPPEMLTALGKKIKQHAEDAKTLRKQTIAAHAARKRAEDAERELRLAEDRVRRLREEVGK
jgi:hypothetical protein